MTQVELAESVFAKLAENVEFIPESEESMELGKFIFAIVWKDVLNFFIRS